MSSVTELDLVKFCACKFFEFRRVDTLFDGCYVLYDDGFRQERIDYINSNCHCMDSKVVMPKSLDGHELGTLNDFANSEESSTSMLDLVCDRGLMARRFDIDTTSDFYMWCPQVGFYFVHGWEEDEIKKISSVKPYFDLRAIERSYGILYRGCREKFDMGQIERHSIELGVPYMSCNTKHIVPYNIKEYISVDGGIYRKNVPQSFLSLFGLDVSYRGAVMPFWCTGNSVGGVSTYLLDMYKDLAELLGLYYKPIYVKKKKVGCLLAQSRSVFDKYFLSSNGVE